MTWRVPLSDIDLDGDEIEAVTSVLRSKWLSMGPVTERFEEAFASYLGVKHAIGVSNCTAALHLAHQALGIGPGDEVITPPLTFVATANSILYCGASPVFADIKSQDDLNISSDRINEAITPRTRAITVVHYAGFPCDMEPIREIARDHRLRIVEDAAHAAGAAYRGKKCGTLGDIGCFSFFANKNLVTGEGGMVVTDDDDLARKIRILRSHGMTTLTWDRHRGHAHSYDVVDTGYNYRLNEMASAIGLVQLKKLDRNNAKREEITRLYRSQLGGMNGISLPFATHPGRSSYHIFPLLVRGVPRDQLMDDLKREGIQTSIHYPPIHLFTHYRTMFGLKRGSYPETESAGDCELTLPLHPLMTHEDVISVTHAIKRAVEAERP